MNVEYQLNFGDNRNPNCPFKEYLDEHDDKCYDLGLSNGYEFLSENHPKLSIWLSSIRGIDLDDLVALPMPDFKIPKYIPSLADGSTKLIQGNSIKLAGVSLQKIYSLYSSNSSRSVRKFLGVPDETDLILFNYAEDKIIEDIWADRARFFDWIYKSKFKVVTGINYSIWFNQPHAERLINLKRNLITFIEMQKIGIPAIPHLYWNGYKDLDRIAKWLNENPNVKIVAVNAQTLKTKTLWDPFATDLKYLISKIDPSIHFIISGPSTLRRLATLAGILPNFSFSNTKCALQAYSRHELVVENNRIIPYYSAEQKNKIFYKNLQVFETIIQGYRG